MQMKPINVNDFRITEYFFTCMIHRNKPLIIVKESKGTNISYQCAKCYVESNKLNHGSKLLNVIGEIIHDCNNLFFGGFEQEQVYSSLQYGSLSFDDTIINQGTAIATENALQAGPQSPPKEQQMSQQASPHFFQGGHPQQLPTEQIYLEQLIDNSKYSPEELSQEIIRIAKRIFILSAVDKIREDKTYLACFGQQQQQQQSHPGQMGFSSEESKTQFDSIESCLYSVIAESQEHTKQNPNLNILINFLQHHKNDSSEEFHANLLTQLESNQETIYQGLRVYWFKQLNLFPWNKFFERSSIQTKIDNGLAVVKRFRLRGTFEVSTCHGNLFEIQKSICVEKIRKFKLSFNENLLLPQGARSIGDVLARQPSLTYLNIDFQENKFSKYLAKSIKMNVLGMLSRVERLHLGLKYALVDVRCTRSLTEAILQSRKTLQELSLDLLGHSMECAAVIGDTVNELKQLVSLVLNVNGKPEIIEEAESSLKPNSKLKQLQLIARKAVITKREAQSFGDLFQKYSNLECLSLDFNKCQFDREGFLELHNEIRKVHALKQLRLSVMRLGDWIESAQMLGDIISKQSHLTSLSLNLEKNNLKNSQLTHILEWIAKCTQLRELRLNLKSNPFAEQGIDKIAETIERLEQLRQLEVLLDHKNVTRISDAIHSKDQLTELNLALDELDSENLLYFFDGMKKFNRNLTQISFSLKGIGLSESELTCLGEAITASRKQLLRLQLNVNGNNLKEEGVQIIVRALGSCLNLTSLDLGFNYNKLSDSGVEVLVKSLSAFKKLKELKLGLIKNKLSVKSIESIGKLIRNHLIQINEILIDASKNNLNETDVNNIRNNYFKSVQTLNIKLSQKIELKSEIQEISQNGSQNIIKSLKIGKVDLFYEGAISIRNIMRKSQFEDLQLVFDQSDCSTSKGIKVLGESIGLIPNLTRLDLSFQRINTEGEIAKFIPFFRAGFDFSWRNLRVLKINLASTFLSKDLEHAFAQGIAKCTLLESIWLNLRSTAIETKSIKLLEQSIASCTNLSLLELDISQNSLFSSLRRSFGKELAKCKRLNSVTFVPFEDSFYGVVENSEPTIKQQLLKCKRLVSLRFVQVI